MANGDKSFKNMNELKYWKGVVERKGKLNNESYYKKFYTDFFHFNLDDYNDKTILDIGCGPAGSLEWADMAKLRVGLDPLVNEYYKLNGGTLEHKMTYVKAKSEDMPFPDEYFDYVFSMNSLDHVDDLDLTISEIKRVCKINGIFSCLVNANHNPTNCEPITIPENLKEKFFPEFELIEEQKYEIFYKTGMGRNIENNLIYDEENKKNRPYILFLKMRKIDKYENNDLKYKNDVFVNKSFEELNEENKALKEENLKLKNKIKEYKNRKVVRFADKIKGN